MKKIVFFIVLCSVFMTAFSFEGKSTPGESRTFNINQTQNHSGVMVSLKSIKVSKDDTKVFISILNQTKGSIFFDSADIKMIQGQKQYIPLSIADSSSPGPLSTILSGTISEGTLTFPPLDLSLPVKLIISCHTEDYKSIIVPFSFELNNKNGTNFSNR